MPAPAARPREAKMPRLTVNLSPAKYREISLLRRFGDASTITDLVNSALTLLKWAMLERSRGYKICAVSQIGDKTTLRELEMPMLSSAGSHEELADELAAIGATSQPAYAAREQSRP